MASYTNGFRLAHGEYFEECPYNRAHQVTNAKILVHLDRCRQQYKKEMAAKGQKVEIATCRYNFIHQYPKIEMDFHENYKCPNRNDVIETIRYHTQELPGKLAAERAEAAAEAAAAQPQKKKSSKSKNVPPPPPDPLESEENWDEEAKEGYTAGYDPKEKLETKCFLYHPMGLSKSERKQHRYENRKRYQKEEEEKMAKAKAAGIPGLNYVDDIKIKQEKDDEEWEKETTGFPTPRREEPFPDVKIKTESWSDEVDDWDTETVANHPVAAGGRIKEEKQEPEEEIPNYDWDEL